MSTQPSNKLTLARNGQVEDQPIPQQAKQALRNLRKLAGQAQVGGSIDDQQQVYKLLEENTRLLMDILNSLPEDYEIHTDG